MQFAPITAGASRAVQAIGERQSEYFDEVVRYGVIATVFWGVVGFLVGVVVALQLAFPDLNIEPLAEFWPASSTAHLCRHLRLRRQRADRNLLLCGAAHLPRQRLFGGDLGWFVFWGYQFFIVMAATGYLLGITRAVNMPSRNGMSTCG